MASNVKPKTIVLRGSPEVRQAVANGAITPGQLLVVLSTGKVDQHATAAGVAQPIFAIENDIIGGNIDTDVADGDICQYVVARRGDQVYAWLKDEENVAIGALLESDGAGALKATTHGTGSATAAAAWPVARAVEALDGTGLTGPLRIKVEVI